MRGSCFFKGHLCEMAWLEFEQIPVSVQILLTAHPITPNDYCYAHCGLLGVFTWQKIKLEKFGWS